MYLISVGLLILLTATHIMTLNTNECTYNSTKKQLLDLLSSFSNDMYKNDVAIIQQKLEECLILYRDSSNNLFFLERSLKNKLNNLTVVHTSDIETHLKLLSEGLTFALRIKPHFFRRDALAILTKNINMNLFNNINIFQKTHVFTTEEEAVTFNKYLESISSLSSHPQLQKILKDSTILFLLFASIADVCVGPPMTICPILVLLGLISSILWMFRINDIFNGIL